MTVGCGSEKTVKKEDNSTKTSEGAVPDADSGSTAETAENSENSAKAAENTARTGSTSSDSGTDVAENGAEANMSTDDSAKGKTADDSAAGMSADDSAIDKTADNSTAGMSADDSAAAEDSSQAAPRKLKYIDAWKEWHTMDVDPSVDECVYVPELFVEDEGEVTYLDDHYDVLQGVDVSEHQGYIDWETVAASGIEFAFIRVGYRGYGEAGTLIADATAVDNLKRASEAGIITGTYFFSQALNEEEAREEARLAVSVIEEAGVDTDLPLMYDPELIRDDWGRANEITREQVALNTAAFCEEVEQISSVSTDIYSNLPWEHNLFDADTLNQHQIWYADYEELPQTPYHFSWWQYTNEGSVPGIEGPVDRNLWLVEAASED